MKKQIIILFGIMTIVFGFHSISPATSTLILEDLTVPGSRVVVTDGLTGDANGAAGSVTYIGSVGNFLFNVATGMLGPDRSVPQIGLRSLDISSKGGTLRILYSEDNWRSPDTKVGYDLFVGGTTRGSVVFSAYLDTGNNLFGISGQGVTKLGGLGLYDNGEPYSGTTYYGPIQPDYPFSLTLEVIITHPKTSYGASTGFSAQLIDPPVGAPEPTSLLLLGSGLAMVGMVKRMRGRRK